MGAANSFRKCGGYVNSVKLLGESLLVIVRDGVCNGEFGQPALVDDFHCFSR